MVRGDRLHDAGGPVATGIIDHDHLMVDVRRSELLHRRADGLSDGFHLVVGGDDHGQLHFDTSQRSALRS